MFETLLSEIPSSISMYRPDFGATVLQDFESEKKPVRQSILKM